MYFYCCAVFYILLLFPFLQVKISSLERNATMLSWNTHSSLINLSYYYEIMNRQTMLSWCISDVRNGTQKQALMFFLVSIGCRKTSAQAAWDGNIKKVTKFMHSKTGLAHLLCSVIFLSFSFRKCYLSMLCYTGTKNGRKGRAVAKWMQPFRNSEMTLYKHVSSVVSWQT